MLACVDVDYREHEAVAACLQFRDGSDASGSGEPGLGAHLYEALGRHTPVIGVAKTSSAGSSFAVPVLRGTSQVPLYITAAGLPAEEAATYVKRMHGAYRIPTFLKRVDRLCRDT